MTPAPSESPDATTRFRAFVLRHDALLQNRAAVLGHVYGAIAADVLLLTRAELWTLWTELDARHEADRITVMSLALVRAAGLRGADRHRTGPEPRADVVVHRLEPRWRHPDPWALLTPREARPLRALRHLDPRSRDIAVLRWLGIDDVVAAGELGLAAADFAAARDHAMVFWAHVVRAGAGVEGDEQGAGA